MIARLWGVDRGIANPTYADKVHYDRDEACWLTHFRPRYSGKLEQVGTSANVIGHLADTRKDVAVEGPLAGFHTLQFGGYAEFDRLGIHAS